MNVIDKRNMVDAAIEQAQRILADRFGYDSFRPGQAAVVQAVLSQRDALAIMPTGAGKSICYQVPAVALPGLALVISPLVSLMADQVRAVKEAGIAGAYLNSSLTPSQQAEVLRRAAAGVYDLMYVAPERLSDPRFADFAAAAQLSLVAIDEAHCVSQWGQDFRPSYLAIGDFITSLPSRPPVVALTATATPRVRDDIERLLGLHDPVQVSTGFDRPNLYFSVERRESKQKAARLDAFLEAHPNDSGIIYCSKRAIVEEVCDHLQERGLQATRYHAGLSNKEREQNQRAFVNDEAPVMVATNAFGMGIDKSNVRYVVHYNMPASMEAYYQEAGRAGRDGQPSECLLMWCDADIATGRYFIELDTENEALTPEETEVVRATRRRMLESMVGYCYTTGCLRAHILRYFGEEAAGVLPGKGEGAAQEVAEGVTREESVPERNEVSAPTHCCSNCEGEFTAIDVTQDARKIMRCVQALRGRFGKTTIVDVLRGAETENLRQWGLTKLPVYGITEAKRTLLLEVIELLAADGYLSITDGKFPLVGFGPRYREAAADTFSLAIKQTPKFQKSKRKAASQTPSHETGTSASLAGDRGAISSEGSSAYDPELFERLRTLRMRLAKEAGMPPYIIFNDATLAAMAETHPQTPEALLALPGVGLKKLERYGDAFLDEIRNALQAVAAE